MIMHRSAELDERGLEAPPQELPEPAPPLAARGPSPDAPEAAPRTRVQLVRSMAEHRVRQAIWLVVGAVDAVVGLDFVFRLIEASNTGVAHLIFVAGSWLAGPFDGIFARVPRIAGLTLRWSDLLVLLLATVIGWQVVKVAGLSGGGRRQQIIERVVV
jgi:hypothetical protein